MQRSCKTTLFSQIRGKKEINLSAADFFQFSLQVALSYTEQRTGRSIKMKVFGILLILVIQAWLISGPVEALSKDTDLVLDYDTAVELAQLPLECYNKEYPYKSGIVYNSSQDVQVRG